MTPRLMHPDRDFDPAPAGRCDPAALTDDLGLNPLLGAMAGGDAFLLDVARSALFAGLRNDAATVVYRHEILRDCVRHPQVIRGLYRLAVEAIDSERRRFGIFTRYAPGILRSAIDVVEMFFDVLVAMRDLGRAERDGFGSRGCLALFALLERDVSDPYVARVRDTIGALKFRHGTLLSARLGAGNQGTGYVLHERTDADPPWWSRLFGDAASAYTYRLPDRDEAGARALSDLHARGINAVANALAQSADHILQFFQTLRTELGFYLAWMNLRDRLGELGTPVCVPTLASVDAPTLRAQHLYDPALALQSGQAVVGNELDTRGRPLVIITGANRGGKSSFLRAIGLAQLMMQCGGLVAAESFDAPLCSGLFTHYAREEDRTMTSGKLDEELSRMSEIADRIAPGALLLCNESFAATNEREGSAIATQVVRALLDKHIRVFFVTHLHEGACHFVRDDADRTVFLRAERRPDGTRTFKLVEGEPLDTGHGADLYRQIFAEAGGDQQSADAPTGVAEDGCPSHAHLVADASSAVADAAEAAAPHAESRHRSL